MNKLKKWICLPLLLLIVATAVLACGKMEITGYSREINVAMEHLGHKPNIDASALVGDYYSGDDMLSVELEEGEELYSIGYFMLGAGNLGFDGTIIDVTDHTITIYVDDYDFMEQEIDELGCATYNYTLEDGIFTLEPEGTFYLNGVGEPE